MASPVVTPERVVDACLDAAAFIEALVAADETALGVLGCNSNTGDVATMLAVAIVATGCHQDVAGHLRSVMPGG